MKESYTFSIKEKILILILVVILIGLGYYYFVDSPVRSGIREAGYNRDELQSEYDILSSRVIRMQNMQDELESMDLSTVSYMESYNANKQEIEFLNELLADAVDYSIEFDDVTKDGNQIRRPFVLRFVTRDYATAKKILNGITGSRLRCLIADEEMSFNYDSDPDKNNVTVALNAIFYETMIGGVEDAGLPVESTAAATATEDEVLDY